MGADVGTEDIRARTGFAAWRMAARLVVLAVAVVASHSAVAQPTAPRNTQATAADRQVKLEWDSALNRCTNHEYRYEIDDSRIWNTVTFRSPELRQSVVVRNLINGRPYTFKVRLFNGGGCDRTLAFKAGPPWTVTVVPHTTPSRPTGLTAAPGDGQVTLEWQAPVDDGGAAIEHYEYEVDGSGSWTQTGTRLGARVSGLTNGTSHTFRVRAVNGDTSPAGNGETAEVTATPFGLPSEPRNLLAEPRDGQVKLTWAAPRDTGGFDVERYEYEVDGSGSWEPARGGAGAVEATVRDLTNDQRYEFKVRAVTSKSTGDAATIGATPVGPPSAPADLAAAGGNRQVRLTWEPPESDGGSDIVRYQYRVDGSGDWEPVPAANREATVTGLANGQSYRFELRAVTGTMARHPLRACVSALLVALAGAVESQTAELPDIVIDPQPSPTVKEGETLSAGVKLESEPDAGLVPITVSFSVSGLPDGLSVTFRPSTLTFDADNFDDVQTVTAEVGHDDDAVQAEGTFEYSVIAAGGTRIDGSLPVPITILDDDTPALSLSRPSVRLIEGGESVTYEVSLAARPTEDVTVDLSLEGTAPRRISVDPATLVFTPESWDRAQTVALQVPAGAGVAPLMDASVLHTASGAPEFGDVTSSLSLSVSEPLPAVSELSVRSLPDGFEASWDALSEAVAGYRVEFVPWTGTFGTPGSNPGRSVGRDQTLHRAGGLVPDSLYQVRVVAFEGSRASPQYGEPSSARLVVIGENAEVDPALSGPADAASALVALGFGSSLLEAVAARVAGDREPVAHASSAALASWSRAFDGSARTGRVLSVHERSPQDRAESERARRTPRRGWGLPAGGPVERGDWSAWARADLPGLGGTVDAYSLDGSARILHLGIERSIEPPAAFDRVSEATSPDGEWLAGIGLGLASASVDIDPAGASLDHSARLVYPYLGYRDDRKLAYALVGGGFGTSRYRHPAFQPAASEPERDQDTLLVFVGLGGSAVVGGRPDRAEFLARTSLLGALANTDAGRHLPTRTVSAYRARLGLDARHARGMGGGILSPSAGLGILYDGGDGPAGVALEADAGTRFDWRRFSFSARARTLLASSDDLDRTLSLSGAVRYSPGGRGRGFFLTVSPSYGSGPDRGSSLDRVLASSGPGASVLRLEAEAGYAFSAAPAPGLVTVVAGLDSGPDESSHGVARAEIRYRGRSALAVGLRHTFELGDPERASVALRIRWHF